MDSTEPTPNPVSLIETDELVRELYRRFDSVILATATRPKRGRTSFRVQHNGAMHECIGLVELLKERLWISARRNMEQKDDEG